MLTNHSNEEDMSKIVDMSDLRINQDDDLNLEEFDELPESTREILFSINLNKPKSAYSCYVSERRAKENTSLLEANKRYPEKWRELTAGEKKKYQELAKLDRQRYQKHLDLVKKHLIKLPLNHGPTGFGVYLEENLKKAIENNQDPSEAKKEAAVKWEEMSIKEKTPYDRKRNFQEETYRNLKYSWYHINYYKFFCSYQARKASKKGRKHTFQDSAVMWRKLKQSEKDKYKQFLDAINKEKSRLKTLYGKSRKFKLRKPYSAYNLFLKEIRKNTKIKKDNYMSDASKMWNELAEKQKDKYQKLAKLDQVVYKIKKIEYQKTLKKPAKTHDESSAFVLFCDELIFKRFPKIGEEGYFEYFFKKWKYTNKNNRAEYKKRAKDLKLKFKNEKEETHELTYELPKKPKNPYNCYMQQNLPKLKNENPKKDIAFCLRILGENWRNLPQKEKEEYEKLSKKTHELYNSQMKEFNENGYFRSLENGKKKSSPSISDQSTKKSKKEKKNEEE